MVKASDFESEDCRFESCVGHSDASDSRSGLSSSFWGPNAGGSAEADAAMLVTVVRRGLLLF